MSRLPHMHVLAGSDRLTRMLDGASELFVEPDHVALAKSWHRQWPRLAWFRVNPWLVRDRWVRFHYLPRSKEYPTTPAEEREILRRYAAILDALTADGGSVTVVVEQLGATGPRTVPHRPARLERGIRRILPDARWIGVRRELDEDAWNGWGHLWVAERESGPLDDILASVTALHERPLLLVDGGRRLFRPYEGGVDVCVETTSARDALVERFPTWLSPRRYWEPRADEAPLD